MASGADGDPEQARAVGAREPLPRRRDSPAAISVMTTIQASAPARPALANSHASTAPTATSCTSARSAATTIVAADAQPLPRGDRDGDEHEQAGDRDGAPARDRGHGASQVVSGRRAGAGCVRGPCARGSSVGCSCPSSGGCVDLVPRSSAATGPRAVTRPSCSTRTSLATRSARRDVVADEHDRQPVGDERADHRVDGVGRAGVERRGRLVEQQHLGPTARARARQSRWSSPPRQAGRRTPERPRPGRGRPGAGARRRRRRRGRARPGAPRRGRRR